MMDFKTRYYPESKFGGFTDIDGTIKFYTRLNALVRPEFVLLDYGCGRGEFTEDRSPYRKDLRLFKHKCRRVIGIDVDSNARNNPSIDEFYLIDRAKVPLPDHSVDICVCDWVLEHIENPHLFFCEMQRVIKPGGYLCIRTSNRWSYVSFLARTIREKHHGYLLSKAQPFRDEIDVFPKYFRCNTVHQLRNALPEISREFVVYGYEAEPAYLNFSRWTYLFGVYFHKLVPAPFRSTIFAFARMNELLS